MVNVAVALGADKEVAEQAMKEVLEFETAFIGELQTIDDSYIHETSPLKEIQETVPWIDLTKLLKVYLPESFKLLPEENIIAKNEFFHVLDKFVKRYPPRTFVNYMIGKGAYPLFDYVHHDIKIFKPEDEYFGKGLNDKEDTRFTFCSKIVTESSLGPAMAAYLGSMYSNASKVASEMTKVIIEELAKEVEESDWLDEVTRKEAAKNISKIKLDVRFPPKIMDLELVDKLYEGYEMNTSNFFDAITEDNKWIKRRDFDMLYKNKTPDDEFDNMGWNYYMIKGLSLSARFIQRCNSQLN